jgi:hypothetical protein
MDNIMSKITAVEWLVDILVTENEITLKGENYKLFEQAKEMENEQRQKDFKAGNDSACMEHENIEDYFKQYIKSE